MESAMKRNVFQKINEDWSSKRLFKHIHTIKTVEITVKNGSYASLFTFHTSLGVLMDTYRKYTGNLS